MEFRIFKLVLRELFRRSPYREGKLVLALSLSTRLAIIKFTDNNLKAFSVIHSHFQIYEAAVRAGSVGLGENALVH